MRRQARSLRSHFLVLLLGTLLPLLGLSSFWVYREAREERRTVHRATDDMAERVAAEVSGQIARASGVLDTLAGMWAVRGANPSVLSRLLARTRAEAPSLENIARVTMRGEVVTSAVPLPPGGRVSVADQRWFREVVRMRQRAYGTFQIGRVSGKPSVVVARPLGDARGRPVGVLYASMALSAVRSPTLPTPAEMSAAWVVVDADRRVLFSSGPPYRGGESLADPLQSHRVTRTVRGTPWQVVVEIPTMLLTNRVRRACRLAAAPALALLLFAGAIGCAAARRIWDPLRQLAGAIRQTGWGGPLPEVPLAAGVEIQAVAGALRTALERLARQRDALMALLQAQAALALSLDLEAVLRTVVDQAARLTGVPGVRLFLRDARAREFRCRMTRGIAANLAAPPFGVADALVEQVAATGRAHGVAGTDRGSRPVPIDPSVEQLAFVRLGWPLGTPGEPEGVLVFDTPTPRSYPSDGMAVLSSFAHHAGLAIRHAALYRGEQDRRRQLEVLRAATTEVFAALEVTPLLQRILTGVSTLMQVEAAGLYAWNEEEHAFVLRVSCGQGPWCTTPRLAVAEPAGRPADTPNDGAVPPASDHIAQAIAALGDPGAWPDVIVEPLAVSDRLVGVLGVNTAARPPLSAQERDLLALFAASAALALANARLFERVQTGHAELARLSRRLVAVQEAERGHLARELHDEIGQVLTGLKFSVEAAGHVPPGDAAPHLERTLRLVDGLIGQVRALSVALRPAILDDFGVTPAIEWLTSRVATQTGVHVAVRSVGVEGRRFGPEVETAIFRVVQEALTNVARHAGVHAARVALVARQRAIRVRIVDRGAGFAPGRVVAGTVSRGLAGMRERVALLGGRLGVQSQPGRGTRVTVEIPIPPCETQAPARV